MILCRTIPSVNTRAAESTAQFTVIVDDKAIPDGSETLPGSTITTTTTGRMPQLNDDHSSLLIIIGVELVLLTLILSWRLRGRRVQQ
ncbi:hypothetical protein FD09_GL000790 [Schleiferilactobacillus perolens DSM 12744]|uniref:Uncharacterized protein n=1 Tax=Schleiferilactobacillus perolens DSM 12744 TaxID=1423792 RepID=A0A0R1MU46_9LACO|nr:hypothetical protein FD09_GL000790 [Schleiferilactobacillus perolens DSM 12744]